MAFIETQAVKAVLLVVVIAAVFAGMTFAGVAIFLALMPYMHAAWAAVLVATALIVPVLLGASIVRMRAAPPRARPAVTQAASTGTPDDAAMALIADMAKEKPLLAVFFAGLLGAAGTILQHKVQQRPRVN